MKRVLSKSLWSGLLRSKFVRFSSSVHVDEVRVRKFELNQFPVDKIRNFSVIAHVDHGKSTLCDRLLEATGLLSKEEHEAQYLDKLRVEKERGITVKAQTVSLVYRHNGEEYLLNLIDTPGHVDFCYEVWRSLSACQGAVLLIDGTSGVQAQTVAHFNHALLTEVTLIPAINKIDSKKADVGGVCAQLKKLFAITENEVLKVSAKEGIGIDKVLTAIVEQIPPPDASPEKPSEVFLFDTWYESFKGVVCLVVVLNGQISVGQKIVSTKSKQVFEVKSAGVLHPDEIQTGTLFAGQVGFITANIRDPHDAIIGDILVDEAISETYVMNPKIPKIPEAKPMLYAGIFPCDQSQTTSLKASLEKLALTDRSVTIATETSPALGYGFRLGFLGVLHMEVFNQRLDQDFDAPTVVTAPSVTYKVKLKGEKYIKECGTDTLLVNNPMKLPDPQRIEEFYEPMILGTIITPSAYLSEISNLCRERRGEERETTVVDDSRMMLQYLLPLSEVIIDFYDALKSVSSGYASFDYEDAGYEKTSVVRLDYLLNGELVEELSSLVYTPNARKIAVEVCAKLKTIVPRQQYNVAIQAAVGKKILCRENIKPYRKDMAAKAGGGTGDPTRIIKLLERQKEGKKRLRSVGKLDIPRDSFIRLLRK